MKVLIGGRGNANRTHRRAGLIDSSGSRSKEYQSPCGFLRGALIAESINKELYCSGLWAMGLKARDMANVNLINSGQVPIDGLSKTSNDMERKLDLRGCSAQSVAHTGTLSVMSS